MQRERDLADGGQLAAQIPERRADEPERETPPQDPQ
jgi:hypothetical protein